MHGIEKPVRSGTATTLELPRGTVTLRRGRGGVDDGSALRAVYDRLTEGFATPDLLAARELLA